MLTIPSPCSTEGRHPGDVRLAEQAAAPAGVARNHALGRLRDPGRAALGPLCREPAGRDRRQCRRPEARPGAEARFRSREMPRWSAERRAGRRHRPVISGEPEIGPTARRATGCGASAPSACRRSAPLVFRERKTTAPPAPQRTGAAERWLSGLFENRIGVRRRRLANFCASRSLDCKRRRLRRASSFARARDHQAK